MSNFEEFGVIVVLPECAFRAELPRESILSVLKDIDDQLDEQGIPDEPETRSEIIVTNARALSWILHKEGKSDGANGIADIAYSFVYAMGKILGIEQLDNLRGLTGSYLRNILRMNPCLNEIDFQQESDYFSQKIADHDKNRDDEWDLDISRAPTFH